MTSLKPPNHILWRTSHNTALLAIETGHNPNHQNPHIHLRMPQFFPSESMELGPTPGSTCVILKVEPENIVHITRWDSGRTLPDTYHVTYDFTLLPVDRCENARSKFSKEIEKTQRHSPAQHFIDEIDLEFLFAQDWPEWLKLTLEAQLRHWRKHHVEHYYHFTPWEMSRDDVWRCVQGAPSQALRRFGTMLSASQREICCRKAPQAAAAYAFEFLDSFARPRAIEDHPEEVLRNASPQLTDSELIALATRCPLTVFKCYRCMAARQRALALSAALKQRRGFLERPPLRDFLLESLVEFTAEWLAGSGGSFDAILTAWADRLGLIPTGQEVMEILQRLNPAYQEDFVNGIARSI